ncbi:ribonuclease H-like protein [Clathrospora elynae]|uniref:Ribonuclease H-like protein n=1 Tax=Clathrospora elynae TaxID=706981 RepID=A0A6A5SUM9_9PLEO|nr:ribonuclease H-like protein [Clathrospora elynae]
MAPKPRTVTAKALQALLTRIGSASSGTKAVLQDRFSRDINKSLLFTRHPGWETSRPTDLKLRIVSIDMGIKNLAFCDAEISYPTKNSLNATMEIVKWEKIDLVKTTRHLRSHLPSSKATERGSAEDDEDVDPYSLSVLSSTAYKLIKNTILAGAPDVVLIEKQRWRSGGGSAIQQWTVRVNTLEGMLWAVLETLRSERVVVLPRLRDREDKRDYEVFGVDPKRVGHYWLGQNMHTLSSTEQEGLVVKRPAAPSAEVEEPGEDEGGVPTKKKLTRSKAEKKIKIAILRSWLSSNLPSTAHTTSGTAPVITFRIGANAESTRQALCSPKKSPRRRKTDREEGTNMVKVEDIGETELKKLDDVTDCFLQAAAWVSWESNRLQLLGVQKRKRGDNGAVAELGDDVLLEMVKEVEKG